MKCKNCNKEIPYFSPNKTYCSKQCEEQKRGNEFEDLFPGIFKK